MRETAGIKSGSGKTKKKKGKKAGDKAAEGANKSTVPGYVDLCLNMLPSPYEEVQFLKEIATMRRESGVCLDDSFAEMLTTIGLGNFIKVFEQNNITNLASCR